MLRVWPRSHSQAMPGEIAEPHSRHIRRIDLAELRRGHRAKNPDQLCGRTVVAAAHQIGPGFQRFLQCHARERPAREIRFRIDGHHDARVGIALIAGILAHTVRDHATRLGRGSHHRAPRTHAETVDRTPVARVMHEFVVRGTQFGSTGETPQARDIDQRLRMLDAKANSERLGLDKNTASIEHAKGVARTMTEREYDVPAAQCLSVPK